MAALQGQVNLEWLQSYKAYLVVLDNTYLS